MVMLNDYHVSYRTEESIAQVASKGRDAAGQRNSAYFNIVKLVEGLERTWRDKGFTIKFLDHNIDGKPAYVEFNPPTLYIDREVWNLADLGDPESRFIVAHELGHLVLHDQHAKAFSDDPSERIKFDVRENSAEWQANTFATYFLLPDNLVRAYRDARDLAASCAVYQSLAQQRLDAIEDCDRRRKNSGICPTCGNFSLNRSDGTCGSDVCCMHQQPSESASS